MYNASVSYTALGGLSLLPKFLLFWHRGVAQKLAVLGAVSILLLCSCCGVVGVVSFATAPSNQVNVVVTRTSTPTATARSTARPTASAPAATPSSEKLSASQKQQVLSDLNSGLSYYVNTWHQGQQILGTTQYTDASAGLAAMSDPNSAASRFSAWRQSTKIEQDVSTYIDAYNKSDAFYNAGNEPQALSDYLNDMGTLQADISQWVTDAVGWQIQTTDNATMAQDVQTINTDIAQVQSDITATMAAS